MRLLKLDVREPRLRRVHYGRVLSNHPVNEEFEEQLSKPFYFRQEEHGAVPDVLFPKTSESPEIAAFKKGKSNISRNFKPCIFSLASIFPMQFLLGKVSRWSVIDHLGLSNTPIKSNPEQSPVLPRALDYVPYPPPPPYFLQGKGGHLNQIYGLGDFSCFCFLVYGY